MNIKRYRFDVKGMTPLVMNSNAAMAEGVAPDKGRDKLQWERDHMEQLLYRNADGGLIIPSRALKKALVVGSKFAPNLKPKGTNFKSFGPLIDACVIVEDDLTLNDDAKIEPWVVVVNLDPSKGPRGPRGPRCRPMIRTPWAGSTTVVVLDGDDACKHAELQQIADCAGMKCGLLDARAIDMGRCEITVTPVAEA